MNTTTIGNTAQKLERTISRIRDALAHVPPQGEDPCNALHELSIATNRIWRPWLEHCDNIDEAVEAVAWVLGDDVEEVGDIMYSAESEFRALASFEHEVIRATSDSLRGCDVDRDRLNTLFEAVNDTDERRRFAERRVIRSYGALAFVADTW